MGQKKFIAFDHDVGEHPTPEPTSGPAESGAEGGAEGGADRRRHPRLRVGVLTEIVHETRGKIPGITFNLSESGAFLLTLMPLEKGEEVELRFVSVDDSRESVRARVVHGTELRRDVFWSQGVGLEFVEGVPSFLKVEFPQK
jgi:hypothetical protein